MAPFPWNDLLCCGDRLSFSLYTDFIEQVVKLLKKFQIGNACSECSFGRSYKRIGFILQLQPQRIMI